MRSPTRRRRWSVGVVFLVLGLAWFGALRLAEARQAEATLGSPVASSLQWEPCDDVPDAECTTIDVPINWARPDGDQLNLRLARLPALDPGNSYGSLLLIPGGPGVGITAAGGQFDALRQLLRVDELRESFDVVAYDPRGVGESSPIRCAPGPVPDAGQLTTAGDGVLSAEEYTDLAGANAAFAEGCLSATGELYRNLSARDSASDIERIRQALGQDDGLVAYSGSYGTLYASAYLEQYGDHVKALVLDGVVDHSVDLATYGERWARSSEDGFGRFVEWCNQDAACALYGQDVAAVYDEVAAAYPEIKPVVRAILSAGSTDIGWPAIAQRLVAAAAGEPMAAPPGLESSPDPANPGLESGLIGQFRAVLCADYGPQDDYAALADDNAQLAEQAPRFAWLFPQELPGSCVGWPWAATNPPHDLQVGPHPNVLVANGTHDPPTPLVAAVAVWSQIPQARLLIADADGHQVLPFSRCGFEAMVRFLTDPASLAPTTYCPID